jgi:(p)ppGpp synthase/HD superfamily hydrolase
VTDSPALGPEFEKALAYAARVHRAQLRNDTTIPYVPHLLGVAALVLQDGGSQEDAIAGLLHDAAEDQGGQARLEDIRQRFGTEVARIVEACSDSLPPDGRSREAWRPRKHRYLGHLRQADRSVLRVTCADKLDNARAILADHRRIGDAVFERFEAGKGGTLAYYALVLDILRVRFPGSLTEELDRVVMEIWTRAAERRPWPTSEDDLPEPRARPG